MATYGSAFIVWGNPRQVIEYEHDVHGEVVLEEDGSKKILSSTPSYLAELTEQEICDTVLSMWTNSKPGRIGAVIYCVSESGFHHLHMVLEVENADSDRFTFRQIQKIYGKRFHIEPTRGSKKEAEDYIYKRGKYAEKGEKILATAQCGELKGNQGKRTDIKALDEMLDNGMTPQQIMDTVGLGAYRYKTMLKDAYMRKREVEIGDSRNITVYYHVGESWSGKSYTMKKLKADHPGQVYAIANYANGFDKYLGEPILFLDEFRPDSMRYAELLSILNNYVLDVKCRYNDVKMMWTEVHITSVIPPEVLYRGMVPSYEREYDTFAQLRNRITYMVYHWKDAQGFHEYQQPMSEYRNYDALVHLATHKPDKEGFTSLTEKEVETTESYFQTRIAGT